MRFEVRGSRLESSFGAHPSFPDKAWPEKGGTLSTAVMPKHAGHGLPRNRLAGGANRLNMGIVHGGHRDWPHTERTLNLWGRGILRS